MKPRIFIATQKIRDIGGVSRSIRNLLSEIGKICDITLCVTEDYVSPNIILPPLKRVKGSSFLRDCYIDRSLLKYSFFRKIKMLFRRYLRRKLGTKKILEIGLSEIQVPDVQYDVAIGFFTDRYVNSILEEAGDYDVVINKVRAKRKVAWVHTDIVAENYSKDLCRKLFSPFDAIVNVSYDNKAIFDKYLPEFKEKSYTVYNTYNLNEIRELASEKNPYECDNKIHVVTVARVQAEAPKKIRRIVDVCSRLKEDGLINFTWTIVGDGQDLVMLKEMTNSRQLGDVLHFTGLKINPYPYMKYAGVFVLVSQYEGFGMTAREAQILGCPALVTNFGPASEIVDDGVSGIICDNSTEGVYQMMKGVLENPSVLDKFRKYLREHPITNEVAIKQFSEVCGL